MHSPAPTDTGLALLSYSPVLLLTLLARQILAVVLLYKS